MSLGIKGSIKRRLTLTVMLTVGFSLFLACLSFWVYDVVTIRQAMTSQATALARVIGINSAVPLAFADQQAASETLGALSAVTAVTEAVIYDAQGEPFAIYVADSKRKSSFTPPRVEPPGWEFASRRLDLFDEIEGVGGPPGTIFIRWDTQELATRTQWYGTIVLGLLAASIAVALALSARLQRHIADPLAALVRGSGAIANGDLSTQVRVDNKDEIGLLAQSFNAMSARLSSVVAEVRRSTREVAGVSGMLKEAAADMSQEAERQKTAIGDASSSIEQLTDSIQGVNSNVVEVAESARETSSSAIEMDSSLAEIANHMGHLGESIDTTSSSVQQVSVNTMQVVKAVERLQVATDGTLGYLEQLAASILQVKTNAEQSDVLSDDSSQEAAKGMTAVDETTDAMGEIATSFGKLQGSVSRLDEKSQAIDAIIQVIVSVAERTNLLSLNASIIAAQAGEHGKAFAVVANEVNGLAELTQRSTSEISDLIRSVQGEIAAAVTAVRSGSKKVEQGVQRSNLAGSILRQILEKAQNTTTRVREIVSATQRQTDDLKRVDHGINDVKKIVQHIHGAASEQQRATGEIASAIETIRVLGVGVHGSTQEQRKGSRLIADAMLKVVAMIEEIADATKSQTASNAMIQNALQVFREISEESVRWAENMDTMVSTLSERSQKLETEIGRFKIRN